MFVVFKPVRDYLPLQQGLRQCTDTDSTFIPSAVRDYLPLQQGLRLRTHEEHLKEEEKGQRLSSTTTRIKTIINIILS